MGRILAIDYGKKRVGLAVTDPSGIIATGLATVSTSEIWEYLHAYLLRERVDRIVVGNPKTLRNEPSDHAAFVLPFYRKLQKTYGEQRVELMDERFTSSLARKALIEGGARQKDRRNKGLVDKISAVILLQSYLEMKQNK